MALSAAAAAALKKIAVAVATDKNTAKTIGGIVLGAVFIMVIPILAIIAIFQSGAQLDFSALAAQAQSEQLAYFEQVMLAIEDEISAQSLQTDPLRAQMIYLCALQGRENEDDFYTNYIGCFADSQDVYLGVSETFEVTFTEDDIAKIEQLISMAREAQAGPSNNLHARILELTAEDDRPLPEGAFLCPLRIADWKSLITSGFGMRIHPISGERKFHTGLDIGIGEGTALYPAQAGKVLIVGSDNSYGNYIVVYYGGGMASLYAHCSKILAAEGQEVDIETAIARSGDTGTSSGPHLHFEIIQGGVPQNPRQYIR